MPFRPQKTLCAPEKHFPTALILLSVPLKRDPPVHSPDVMHQLQNLWCLDEGMIMIRQHAPGDDPVRLRAKGCKQVPTERIHTFQRIPYKMLMFIARTAYKKIHM